MDVVGPAVQQDDGRAILGTGLDIADIEQAGVDLLGEANRLSGLVGAEAGWALAAPLNANWAAARVAAAEAKKRR
jgi:hypothetical protein